MTMLALLGLLLSPQDFAGAENLSVAAKPKEAIGLFQRVCLAPFTDPAAFEAAVAKDPASLERIDASRIEAAPGTLRARVDIWHSEKFNVHYVHPDNLTIKVPVPQCEVTILLAGAPDQATLAGLIAKTLEVTDAFVAKASDLGYWDLAVEGRKWRMFLRTYAGDDNFMSLKLINIRD